MNSRLATALLLAVSNLVAQDATAVLARYVQVTGGEELYRRYNELHLFYTITYSDESTENVDYFHTRDGKTLIETDTGSATRDTGVSDGVAWKYSEAKGAVILSGKEAARLLAEAKGFDEEDWHARFPAVALLANQSVNGQPCRHLKLTRADSSTVERFYEIKSGLLVREVSSEFDDAGVEQPTTVDFQRYDTFFGLRRPVNLHVKSGAKEWDIQINTVTYSAAPSVAVTQLPHDVVRAIIASRAKPGSALPNPVDIIDKFVTATGGMGNYQKIKTEVVKADVSFLAENLKFSVVTYSAGNKHYSVADIPSIGKFESGDDGFTGWEKSLVMGPKLKPHSTGSEFMGPEPREVLDWSAGAVNMETISQDQVNGAPCYLVRVGAKSDETPTACFDVKSGLLLRTAQKDSDGTAEQIYSNYRSVDGFMVCYRIDTKVAGQAASVQVTEVSINQPIPDTIFSLPPDVRALKSRRDAAPPPISPGAPTLKRPAQDH